MPTMADGLPCEFQGTPCIRLRLPDGDEALVSLHGAQVVSWVSVGRERLYLSPASHWNGSSAIRGGVPVCFPQFNQRGSLVKHGFARNLPWRALPSAAASRSAGQVQQVFGLASGEASRAFWDFSFEARLTVTLAPGSLHVTLDVHNTDERTLTFTGALHTYLAVDDVAAAELSGLQGQAEWDALTDTRAVAGPEPLRFTGEFDRVYGAASQPLVLSEPGQSLRIAQSTGFDQTVVWNPGPELCARLADMPDDGHRRMLCVEAACVDQPVAVPPGQRWQGWQHLEVT